MALSDLPPLPEKATIEPCTEQYIQSFRRMNTILLPIPYRDGFYRETINDPIIASVTRVALWQNIPITGKLATSPSDASTGITNAPQLVAAIRCHLLQYTPQETTPVLYISTLTTLAPYRGHGLAGHLLSAVAQIAVDKYSVSAIVAHVWEANEDGLEWYSKRGFKVVGRDEMYYRRLAPRTAALLVKRDIGPGDVLGWKGESPFDQHTRAG